MHNRVFGKGRGKWRRRRARGAAVGKAPERETDTAEIISPCSDSVFLFVCFCVFDI